MEHSVIPRLGPNLARSPATYRERHITVQDRDKEDGGAGDRRSTAVHRKQWRGKSGRNSKYRHNTPASILENMVSYLVSRFGKILSFVKVIQIDAGWN